MTMNCDTFDKALDLEKEGKKEEAISAYSDFISQCQSCCGQYPEIKEKLALAFNNRGFLQYLRVEFRLAVQDYTQALEHDSHLAVAYYNRGLIHYRLSRFGEAVEDLKQALTLAPDLLPAKQCLQQSLLDSQRVTNTQAQS